MSLTFEEFAEAGRRWAEMDERLNKLIGFNPATSNHYGQIQLYNHRINSKTSDEKILELRSKYVRWRTAIFEIFKGHDIIFNDDQFNELFSYDPMFGTISFLGTVLDLSRDTEYYKEIIKGYIKNNKEKKYDSKSTRINT